LKNGASLQMFSPNDRDTTVYSPNFPLYTCAYVLCVVLK